MTMQPDKRAHRDSHDEGHSHIWRNAAVLHEILERLGGGGGDGRRGEQKRKARGRLPV